MPNHLEAYDPVEPPRMGLGDWIQLLHHYLNYNSIPPNGQHTYSDSDYYSPDIGGSTLRNAEQPQNNIGVWNLGDQGTGFSLDKMPAIEKYNQIMNQNPNLSN